METMRQHLLDQPRRARMVALIVERNGEISADHVLDAWRARPLRHGQRLVEVPPSAKRLAHGLVRHGHGVEALKVIERRRRRLVQRERLQLFVERQIDAAMAAVEPPETVVNGSLRHRVRRLVEQAAARSSSRAPPRCCQP